MLQPSGCLTPTHLERHGEPGERGGVLRLVHKRRVLHHRHQLAFGMLQQLVQVVWGGHRRRPAVLVGLARGRVARRRHRGHRAHKIAAGVRSARRTKTARQPCGPGRPGTLTRKRYL